MDPVVVRGHEEPAVLARERRRSRPGRRASGSNVPAVASSATTTTCASRTNPNRASPRAASAGASALAGELVEEVALEPSLGVGDRARLRELDREQAERVTGHDAVDLGRLLGLADREERLDAALRPHRLDPDVVAAVDEGQREARGLGPRDAQLLPDRARAAASPPARSPRAVVRAGRGAAPTPSRPRRARRRPAATPPPSSTARVRACSASTARCRVSYCSASSRVKTASVIAMNGTSYGTSNSGKPSFSASVDERPRRPVVAEPEPEPEAGDAGRRRGAARTRAGWRGSPRAPARS